jgi:dTDP-4-amino-4,6-dideoxygalactose transaminase
MRYNRRCRGLPRGGFSQRIATLQISFVDLKRQYAEVKAGIEPDLATILETGAYVMGRFNKELEAEIAAYHGCKHAVALNSGTDALRIAMDAMGIGAGDEVITTAFTFVATVETIVQTGARPVFVDIVRDDQMIDPALIEAAITPRTKAICPVHLWGQVANMAPIMEIARKHNLLILEDAAQAIGSHCNGVYAGNFGQAAGISFYVTKNLGAAGDGGLLLTNDDAIAEASRSMRIHGMGRERYYYDHIGYTSRMPELQACILHHKFQKLEEWNVARQRIAAKLIAGLEGSGVEVPVTLPGNNHTWHQFTVLTDDRDALQEHLKNQGVPSMIYYPVPLHYHTPYKHLAERGSLPITEKTSLEVLSLPVHQYLTDDEISHIVASVKSFRGAMV